SGVDIRAEKPAGLFYGCQTLRQMLPPDVYSGTPVAGVEWSLPAAAIEDRPQLSWRGLMLDSGRHFWPPEDVKRFIDLMAIHKLNVFHWHLTDDQGWRLQIRKYPRLTEIGSVRAESPAPGDRNRGDGVPYGG